MSLNLYTSIDDVPKDLKLVDYNDAFFGIHTPLNNSEFEKIALRDIDKATYVSSDVFLGRTKSIGGLYRDSLSTGCKTVLNVEKNPVGYCFDLLECGQNALNTLKYLNKGSVLLKSKILLPRGNDLSCDINYKGVHYNNLRDLCKVLSVELKE